MGIDSLVVKSTELREVGQGTIRGTIDHPFLLILSTTRGEKEMIPPRISPYSVTRQEFLECVDNILKDHKLYFTDVVYRPRRWFMPHKLTGTVYDTI